MFSRLLGFVTKSGIFCDGLFYERPYSISVLGGLGTDTAAADRALGSRRCHSLPWIHGDF